MASTTDARSGIKYGWTKGENNWNTEMDANLVRLGRIGFHLSAKSKTTSAQPGTPTNGDTYILPAGSTGAAWAGNDGKVAVWDGAAWQFYTPSIGWQSYVEDTDVLTTYKAGGWSAGVAM